MELSLNNLYYMLKSKLGTFKKVILEILINKKY